MEIKTSDLFENLYRIKLQTSSLIILENMSIFQISVQNMLLFVLTVKRRKTNQIYRECVQTEISGSFCTSPLIEETICFSLCAPLSHTHMELVLTLCNFKVPPSKGQSSDFP